VSVARLIEGKQIVVCAGPGGVGKTTTAAAVALGMAAEGMKVAVLTIDPAKRLANSLGLEELGNEERRVPVEFDGGGELWALMLDAKRTWDEMI
jgi:anion-transporting  ArsA/GET3 family ATPase